MATWTNYAALIASLASGKAFTDEKSQALAENTLAGLECDPTAPVNAACWHPYDMVLGNDGNDGKFYDFAVDGALASVETPTFVDGWEYRIRIELLSHNAGASTELRLENYREAGAVYNPARGLFAGVNISTTSMVYALIELPDARRSTNAHFLTITEHHSTTFSNSVGAPSNSGFYLEEFSTAQKIGKSRLSFAAGSIDAGMMFLDKRRVYS